MANHPDSDPGSGGRRAGRADDRREGPEPLPNRDRDQRDSVRALRGRRVATLPGTAGRREAARYSRATGREPGGAISGASGPPADLVREAGGPTPAGGGGFGAHGLWGFCPSGTARSFRETGPFRRSAVPSASAALTPANQRRGTFPEIAWLRQSGWLRENRVSGRIR